MEPLPLHVAIIMDGNGRWATSRGLPRTAGHRAGASAARRTVEAAARLGVGTLTLYAFSSDNWQRPPGEVRTLMQLFGRLLRTEAVRCADNGICMSFIGRRDRLEPNLRRAIEGAEGVTAGGRRMHLRLAIDYSARDAIVEAARRIAASGTFDRDGFAHALGEPHGAAPDVDLLVRTGGEQRLSDFLLWECAYAELLFIDVRWPDFGAAHLEAALQAFKHRERRFGGVPLVHESSTGLS